jgi:hypothetical protein
MYWDEVRQGPVLQSQEEGEYMLEKMSLERTLLKEQLNYYRLQRHDFLNHWQVIMGYLQLGKPEKALNYMREGIDGLEAEQHIGQIPQETVSAILLSLVISLRQQKVHVEVELKDVMKETIFWEELWEEEYGQALYGYTRECLTYLYEKLEQVKYPIVRLRFQEEPFFSCNLRLLDHEEVIWENQLELHR